MRRLSNIFLCLTLVGALSGCEFLGIKIDFNKGDKKTDDKYVAAVTEALEDSSKEDCEAVYKIYAGGAEYVKRNAEKLGTTDKWETLIIRVTTDYEVNGKNKDLSKVAREELEARDLKTPKNLDKETTDELVDYLQDTAAGAAEAMEKK